MQLILETDEAWSIMTLVVSQVLDAVELSDEGEAAIRAWRSDHGDGSEPMRRLAEELNVALGNYVDERTRRRIRQQNVPNRRR
jgi:hypothetical protein